MDNRWRGLMSIGVKIGLSTGLALMLNVSACEADGQRDDGAAPVVERAVPEYAATASGYNERLAVVERLRARANLALRYVDEDGVEREEQPEGLLQIIVPDRVALSLGKAGKNLYWFGSDAERYWWFDLDKGPRAMVGTRTADGSVARERLGISIAPWEVVRLLGIVRLDERGEGTTAWSVDGASLVVTTPIGVGLDEAAGGKGGQPAVPVPTAGTLGGRVAWRAPTVTSGPRMGDRAYGSQRLWLDPKDLFPQRVELLDGSGRVLVSAELSGDERLEITRGVTRGGRPRIPAQVTITPADSRALIRLSLSGSTDARISDRAFEFEQLVENFQVEPDDVVDLDREPAVQPVAERGTDEVVKP